MTEQIKQIAERIKEIREILRNLWPKRFASKLGISTDLYLKYEGGE